MSIPKVFISYNPRAAEFEELVLRISKDLRESGVEVILDKWELSPTADRRSFAEKNLTDPVPGKILMIADKGYAEKASPIEPPVISEETYKKLPAGKFGLAGLEKDEAGKILVPDFYRSGVVFDFSETVSYPDNFDKLLRWIFDKPLYQKPPLGKRPDFLDQGLSLGTRDAYLSALEAVKNDISSAEGRVLDYLDVFATNLERFRITGTDEYPDEAVYQSIVAFRPFRDEYINFVRALVMYGDEAEYPVRIHHFFEYLLSYTKHTDDLSEYTEGDLDNFLFIVHELFLYTIAIFLKYEKFEAAAYLLSYKYYVGGKAEIGQEELISFDNIHQHMESLEQRNERLGLGLEAPRAEILRARSAGTGIDLRYLMQTDFTIFLRAELAHKPYYSQWWPETLMFVGHHRGPFEIYLKAASKIYFDKMKIILGIQRPEGLFDLVSSYEEERRHLPRGLTPHSPSQLAGYEMLSTVP